MQNVYDFELEQANIWSDSLHKKMKENKIRPSDDYGFHKLDGLNWGDRYCKKCKELIHNRGNIALCITCQGRYANFTEEALYV